MDLEGKIRVAELLYHPRNDFYFDDIKGDGWDDLLQSIRTSGVTNAITITQDNIIISGHQRVRACKVLGLDTISFKRIMYSEEDIKKQKDIKDLIESNLKQRVVGNPNPIKLGRCFDFLRDYYGIQHGAKEFQGNQYSKVVSPNNSESPTTQQDLANTYNISSDTMENYIKLSKSIPELANLVETGTVTKTTALAIMKNLSEMEQEDLIQHLDVTKKYTQKQVEEYIAQLKSKDDKVKQLESENQKLTTTTQDLIETNAIEQDRLKKRISELVQQGTKYEYIEKEIENPETIQELQTLKDKLKKLESDNVRLVQQSIEDAEKLNHAIGISTNYQLVSHCSEITLKMLNFIKDMSQYDYMAESFNEIPNATRIEYKKCISSVKKWADRILDVIDTEENIINM